MNLTRRQVLGTAGASAAVTVGGGAIAGAEFARRTIRLRQAASAKHRTISSGQDHDWLWRVPVAPVMGLQAVTIATADDALYLLSDTAVHALASDSGRVIWRYPLTSSNPQYLYSGNDGIIYLQTFPVGPGNHSRLSALHARTGRELWHRTTANATIIGPLCDGPVTYLGTSPFNNETGTIYAIEALSGKLIWELPGVGDTQTFLAGNNTPIVVTEQDLPVFTKGNILYTASQIKLHARDKNTGAELWAFSYPLYNAGGPVLLGDKIYLSFDADGTKGGRMIAVDAATGQQAWTGDIFASSIIVSAVGDTVFALATDSGIAALTATDGSTAWTKSSASLSDNLTVSGDVVLISTTPGSVDGGLVQPGGPDGETQISALRSADGHIRWAVTCRGQPTSAPVLAGNWACVGFSQESICVLDLDTGKNKWELSTPLVYGPLVNGNMLFAIISDYVLGTSPDTLSGAVCGIEI
jgi:outer membrane protein assembly factor BamB